MMLADNARRDEEARRHARQAVERVDLFLAGGQATDAQKFAAAQLLGNVALFHKNAGLYTEAIAYARRNIALVPAVDRADEIRAQSWSIIADAMRLSGDLDGALAAIRESRRLLEHVPASDAARIQTRFNVLWREGLILGEEGRISLGRPDEAIVVFQVAFDLVEDWASKDTANAGSRVLVANAARELGELLRGRDPGRALALYDRALRRLGEVKDNPRARRSEVELLSGSSYPLRTLGRSTEARQRIDDAFARLQRLEADPVNEIELGSETDTALRARADHLADTGDTARAIETYRALHDRVSGQVRASGKAHRCLQPVTPATKRCPRCTAAPGRVSSPRTSTRDGWNCGGTGMPGCPGMPSSRPSWRRRLNSNRPRVAIAITHREATHGEPCGPSPSHGRTVRSETPRIAAISIREKPQKNFRSTSADRPGSTAARSSSARLSRSRSTVPSSEGTC